MAWTYTTLKQAIQDYLETDETTFVTNIDVFIRQTEDRILKDIQLPEFRKNVTGSVTGSDQYLAVPTDYLSPYSLAVDNTGLEFLLFKDVNFIREAYPLVSTEGTPKYYGIFDSSFFILGPTPDQSYATELHYFYRPTTIVTASTSWLGTNAESVLLYGCLIEAATFQMAEPDILELYNTRYKEALSGLGLLSVRSTTDSYRRTG